MILLTPCYIRGVKYAIGSSFSSTADLAFAGALCCGVGLAGPLSLLKLLSSFPAVFPHLIAGLFSSIVMDIV